MNEKIDEPTEQELIATIWRLVELGYAEIMPGPAAADDYVLRITPLGWERIRRSGDARR